MRTTFSLITSLLLLTSQQSLAATCRAILSLPQKTQTVSAQGKAEEERSSETDPLLRASLKEGLVWFIPSLDRKLTFYAFRNSAYELTLSVAPQARKLEFALHPENYRAKARNTNNREARPLILRYDTTENHRDARTLIYSTSPQHLKPAKYVFRINQTWEKVANGYTWITLDAVLYRPDRVLELSLDTSGNLLFRGAP